MEMDAPWIHADGNPGCMQGGVVRRRTTVRILRRMASMGQVPARAPVTAGLHATRSLEAMKSLATSWLTEAYMPLTMPAWSYTS